MLTEAVLLIVAIGALLPRFALLAAQETGRDGRFAEAIITVRGLPDPVLPKLCATFGSYAEPIVRDRLCGQTDATPPSHGIDRIPPALTSASALARQAFLAPLQDAQARLADFRQQLREGQDNVLVLGDAIESTEAEIQPFIKRYWIDAANGEGPAAAFLRVRGRGGRGRGRLALGRGADREIPRANVVLLLGAALDGHRAVPSLASVAALPTAPATSQPCLRWLRNRRGALRDFRFDG